MDADFMPKKSLSTFYQPINDREQVAQSKEERAEALKHYDGYSKIIERLDEAIAYYQSLDSITNDVIANPQLLAQTVHANRLTVDNLKNERSIIADIIADITAKK